MEELAEAIDFRSERLAAVPRQAVVAAPLVGRCHGGRGLLHPARFHQPLKRAVDRAGAESQPAGRLTLHLLQDRVPVPFAARQGEKDVDDCRRQRSHITATGISVTVIVVKSSYRCSQSVKASSPPRLVESKGNI